MDIRACDPFELPNWLGTEEITWTSSSSLGDTAQVSGRAVAPTGLTHQLDLLAVDAAYPVPVCPEAERRAAHQAWRFGEVLLFEIDRQLVAAVPGTRFDANLACEVVRRLAKSVGAPTRNYSVSLAL